MAQAYPQASQQQSILGTVIKWAPCTRGCFVMGYGAGFDIPLHSCQHDKGQQTLKCSLHELQALWLPQFHVHRGT